MKRIVLSVAGSLALGLGALAYAQDAPAEIPKKELPAKGVCIVCNEQGNDHGEEKIAAGMRYKGKTYLFCHTSEMKTFKQDPERFLPPVLPRPMPKFALKGLDEREITPEAYKDKILLVDFWATWCKPCVEAMPELQKLHAKFAEKGVVTLGVSIDEKGAKVVKPFLQKRKFTYPMALDSGEKPAWQAFGVRGIPALFLVNREGQIVRQWTGKPKFAEVEKAIEAALEEKPNASP